MVVEISISGHTSALHASAIDENIRELGPYAVEAGRFCTEWESEQGYFYVGTDEQVAVTARRARGRAGTALGGDPLISMP